MKFGKTYLTHQIPEWSIYYMNYKHLKKIIKSIDSIKDSDLEFDETKYLESISETLSSFFFEIDRNIEDVDEFYNTKYKEYRRRLNKIVQVLNFKDNLINYKIESKEELDEIISILIELRILFRNLKWFGELNHRGFIKILKKLDKKLTSILNEGQVDKKELSNNNKEAYLSTRIDALPFANETELANNLDIIHRILLQLGTLGSLSEIKLESLNINNNIESFQKILEEDDDVQLEKQLGSKSEKFNISLLNKATLNNSTKCIDLIWKNLSNLYDVKDINGRNFFHQNVISLGKQQFIKEEQLTPGDSPNWLIGSTNGSDNNNINNTSGLLYVLNKLQDKDLIIAKDHYNRTPLHYAAQYGLVQVTNILLEFYTKWGLIDPKISIDQIDTWGDQESLTPLHLSIIGKHPKTTEVLIKFNSENTLTCPDLLLLSVKLNSSRILNSLINDGKININYTNIKHRNETALYIASKLNLIDVVEFLLESNASTEIGEKIFGWTPIFIAACEGYTSIVKLLIDYDANYDIVDDSGWLPMEHACLRGHLDVADLLKPKNDKLLLYDTYHPEKNVIRIPSEAASPMLMAKDDDTSSSIDKLPENHKLAVNEFYKQLKNNSSNNVSRSTSPKRRKKYKPIKSFGHRYLGEDENLILITLGTTDLRDDNVPVELNKISLAKSFATELDTALSLSITCRQKLTNQPVEPSVVVDLPLEDYHGTATDPISFKLSNNLKVDDIIITFDLIPTYQVNKKVLGRAIAILQDAYTKVGPNLRSLNNNITVPIIESTNLDILGLIRFEYLQVLPFKHHAMSIARSDTYWKQLVSTRVIGHRGLGKNESGRQSLQLGENTVESFIAAASLGASYVEFDVQLTKDFVPVVYHDFTVAESGVDIPMHLLTLEQFLGLNKTREKSNHSVDDEVLIRSKPRAKSSFQLQNNIGEDFIDKEFESQINERMKLTKTWKNKGYKGNARGTSIASNFVTLKDLFKKLPQNVGFNIELKYPMLDEAEQESMGEIAIDLNLYLDTILKVIYDENLNGRHIVFSSFHPDVCLLLSLKQPTMPILFLTEAGTAPMADIRASSLQNAIRFAKKWNLLGIVSAAQTLVKTPRLAQVVKSSGLVCVTYGVENNEPELAKIQMRAGVDAVIVDSVLAVREGLREHNDTVKEFEDSSNSE
ncbi:GDE1 [Candida jiufengensis]|uniref:GDE1 n=1 Tax=Candida jiufengensis TaxID=497108 RepID=UPI00222526ED|nr:GDE1 [Candida jiufengensis]KAI5956274.1 GDE1 [Candida jiufengensis]